MPILSAHFKELSRNTDEIKDVLGVGGSFSKIKTNDPHSLREWWYTLLRSYGKYPCYAIFLVLSSDKDVAQYLKETRTELNAISGSDCLIIVLGSNFFFTTGLENDIHRPDDFMVSAVDQHIGSGESVQAAGLLGIELTQFPCLVFFQDIRSPKLAVLSLKGIEEPEINQTMREVFSVIRRQAREDPNQILEAIQKFSAGQKVSKKKQHVVQVTGAFLGKTIEAAMEAWVKSAFQ